MRAAAALPGSVVPVWRVGLDAGVLAPDYQLIIDILASGRGSGEEAMNRTNGKLTEQQTAPLDAIHPRVETVVGRPPPQDPAVSAHRDGPSHPFPTLRRHRDDRHHPSGPGPHRRA